MSRPAGRLRPPAGDYLQHGFSCRMSVVTSGPGLGLVGRVNEYEVLDRLIADVRTHHSRVLVLRAEPGVGKSALMEHLAGLAEGCRVVRAAGVDMEMELPFAACGPRHSVRPPRRGPADRFLVSLAALSLTSAAAELVRWCAWATTRNGWTVPRRRRWRSCGRSARSPALERSSPRTNRPTRTPARPSSAWNVPRSPSTAARARLLYGEWLRRQNRRLDGREHLMAAYEVLHEIGADAFAERARRELVAAGATARKRTTSTTAALSPQKAQIAQLAADGHTNQEIASELIISPRTVE
jgi:hypothetical protein